MFSPKRSQFLLEDKLKHIMYIVHIMDTRHATNTARDEETRRDKHDW